MMGGGRKLTHVAALLGALALPAIGHSQPQAASRFCRLLEAELAAASGGGKPALVRKYDDAISRQREQLSKARDRSSAASCGFSLFSRNVNECAALNATIDRMNTNLDALQSKRAQLAGGGSRRDRARMLAALDANGCRGAAVAPRRTPMQEANRESGNANLFDQLFDGGSRQLDTLDQPDDPGEDRNIRRVIDPPGVPDFPSVGGEFHTTCVRTCDGYFFPMSNAASLGDFERDQKNCESSCPGTEMQVFYSRGMDDDFGVDDIFGDRQALQRTADRLSLQTVGHVAPASLRLQPHAEFQDHCRQSTEPGTIAGQYAGHAVHFHAGRKA